MFPLKIITENKANSQATLQQQQNQQQQNQQQQKQQKNQQQRQDHYVRDTQQQHLHRISPMHQQHKQQLSPTQQPKQQQIQPETQQRNQLIPLLEQQHKQQNNHHHKQQRQQQHKLQQQQQHQQQCCELCQRVRGELKNFDRVTSLPGVTRIINAKSLCSRLFWSAVFLFAFFMFAYLSNNLLGQYFSYPKKVNVEIVQKPVAFPSVTVCNTDHLHFKIVDAMEKFFSDDDDDDDDVIENDDGDDRNDNDDLGDDYSDEEDDGGGGNVGTESYQLNNNNDDENNNNNNDDVDHEEDDYASNDNSEDLNKRIDDDDEQRDGRNNEGKPKNKKSKTSKRSAMKNTRFKKKNKKNERAKNSLKIKQDKNDVIISSYNNNSRSTNLTDEEIFRDKYQTFQTALNAVMQWKSFQNDAGSPADPVGMGNFLELMSRVGLMANIGPWSASKSGIKAEEFIVYCRFMEEECDLSKFTKIFDPYFFNCYTFEPHKLLGSKATRLAGIEYGLTLLLFSGSAGHLSKRGGDQEMTMIPGMIEADPALANNQGTKVVIHSHNSIPHFTTDGYDIPSGFSANIGVRARQNVRVSLPHGNCTPESDHTTRNSFKYTLISCQNQCIQSKIAEACKCIDSLMPYKQEDLINFSSKSKRLPFCLGIPSLGETCSDPQNLTTAQCQARIKKAALEFVRKTKCREQIYDQMTIKKPESIEECQCHPPCKDVMYDTTYGLSKLPENLKQNSAFYSLVDKHAESLSKETKMDLKNKYGENYLDVIKRKLTRVNVHIADNNVIQTTESPDYDMFRLISDIGGQMGLWIGISVITLLEVCQLVPDLLVILARALQKCWRRRKGLDDSDDTNERIGPNIDKNIDEASHVPNSNRIYHAHHPQFAPSRIDEDDYPSRNSEDVLTNRLTTV